MKRMGILLLVSLLLFGASPAWAENMKPLKLKEVPQTAVNAAQAIPQTVRLDPAVKPVRFSSRVSLNTAERKTVENAAYVLINRHLKADVDRSSSLTPSVQVLSKSGNRIMAEAIVVSRAKDSYTATIKKLDYQVEGDKVTLTNQTPDYAPTISRLKTPARIDASTLKLKKDLLANLKLALPQGHGPKAMANTPCDNISSAVNYTNQVDNIFRQAFGSSAKKIGAASTKSALLDVLKNSNRLVAWNNIGHGNPSCIVQWNDDPIWYTDFNSSVPFKGVYGSVILLNSCNVCASPYNLKNAIKKHNPRTYIGGAVSLPIGPSEKVDKDFWSGSLLQGKTMGTALSQAEQNHGLTGYFCLDGYSGRFATVEAAKITEDCIAFDPNKVEAKKINGRWKVVQGSMWMLDFGSNQAQAQRAVQVIKHYKMNRQCFVGRPNAPMQYYTVNGAAPQGAMAGEDAIPFNPANIQAKKINGRWKVVDGSHWLLDFATKEAEAKTAVTIIKHYGFNRICFVGRPNAPMMYFRK
jgi:hypothetical protein